MNLLIQYGTGCLTAIALATADYVRFEMMVTATTERAPPEKL